MKNRSGHIFITSCIIFDYLSHSSVDITWSPPWFRRNTFITERASLDSHPGAETSQSTRLAFSVITERSEYKSSRV